MSGKKDFNAKQQPKETNKAPLSQGHFNLANQETESPKDESQKESISITSILKSDGQGIQSSSTILQEKCSQTKSQSKLCRAQTPLQFQTNSFQDLSLPSNKDTSRSPPQRDEYLNLRFPNETTKEKDMDSPSSESSLLSRRAMLRKYYLSHSFSSDHPSLLNSNISSISGESSSNNTPPNPLIQTPMPASSLFATPHYPDISGSPKSDSSNLSGASSQQLEKEENNNSTITKAQEPKDNNSILSSMKEILKEKRGREYSNENNDK